MEKTTLLYERVADHLVEMIENGTFKPGEKIISVRQLAKQMKVSVFTVLQAYELLQEQGIIVSRERSGYYVTEQEESEDFPEPEQAQPAAGPVSISINDIVVRVTDVFGKKDIIPFGTASLSSLYTPAKDLRRMTSTLLREMGDDASFYDLSPGNEALQKELSKRSLQWGCRLGWDEFIITNGAMEAIQFSLRAVAKAGDVIAVETPTYYPILQLLDNLGMYALEIPTRTTSGIDLNQFERLLGQEPVKACFLMPNFNNPLGYRQSEEDKKEIVRITAEKNIPIVEDDVYADLYFEGERPRPLKAYDTQGLVLLCSSPSKSLCPGYRVGWVAPGRYKDTIKRLKYMGNISAPTLSQLAMAEFMRSGFYDRHLRKLRLLLKNQIHLYTEAIRQHFPSETRITRPHGGFLLWLELPASVDSFQLYALALEKNMSIAPGPMFSAIQGYRNYIRLSCGLPWSPQIEQAIKIMGSLAKDLTKQAK